MGIRSFWQSDEIDNEKLKIVAKKQDSSVSKLINNLLKNNYDVLRRDKK